MKDMVKYAKVTTDKGKYVFVRIYKGLDMYKKLGLLKNRYGVNMGEDYLAKVDLLKTYKYSNKYFYFTPNRSLEIAYLRGYSDYWYTKAFKKLSKNTIRLIPACLKYFESNGIDSDSLVVFILGDDGKYYLKIDGEDNGFIDFDSEGDEEFKKLINSIKNDLNYDPGAIVFPSQGNFFFFKDTIAVYKCAEDYFISIREKGCLHLLDIKEKGILQNIENSL